MKTPISFKSKTPSPFGILSHPQPSISRSTSHRTVRTVQLQVFFVDINTYQAFTTLQSSNKADENDQDRTGLTTIMLAPEATTIDASDSSPPNQTSEFVRRLEFSWKRFNDPLISYPDIQETHQRMDGRQAFRA